MQEKTESKKAGETPVTFEITPYALANLAVKVAGISYTVSLATQPFQAVLTHFQMPSGTSTVFSNGLFRGLYRGMAPYAIAGQKRGAVAVTSKHANKESIVEEEVETELPILRNKWLGTLAFAQADHFISNAFAGKAKLTSAGVISRSNFQWTPYNAYQLTMVNWGSRSIAGFVNFAAIGFVGDQFSSYYHFNKELYNKIAGGATAGVFATIFTTIPNAYADRKLLATRVEDKRIITTSPYTLFSQAKSHVKHTGVRAAMTQFILTHYLREVAIRSPQSALTFGIILGMDHVMGPEPLKSVWPKEISKEQSQPPSSRM